MSIFPNYLISDHEYDTISLSYPLYDYIEPVSSVSEITECPFFEVVSSPESYHTVPNVIDPQDAWVKIGTVNNVLPSNINAKVSGITNQTVMVYLACTMNQTLTSVGPASVQVKAAPLPVELYEGWAADQLRPSKINIPLGFIIGGEGGSFSITTHRGDIVIGETVDYDNYTNSSSSMNAGLSNSIYYERID